MALPKLSAEQPIVRPDGKPSSPFLQFMEKARTDQQETDARQDEADIALAAAIADIVIAQTTADGAQAAIDSLTPADIGLGNVDNTADAVKSVLEATKLTPGRTINGVAFDGTTDIVIGAADPTARVPTTRVLTAGAGLTGGGDLTADRTFAVGAGTGITVNADDIALTVPTASGTYTPTLTNVANAPTLTAYSCQYMRVGSTVTVSGLLQVDPTATGLTQIGISLPIASDFTNIDQCNGAAGAYQLNVTGYFLPDTTNNRAELGFVTTTDAVQFYSFTFTYRIL